MKIPDMMITGEICQVCGAYVGKGHLGSPAYCDRCETAKPPVQLKSKKDKKSKNKKRKGNKK